MAKLNMTELSVELKKWNPSKSNKNQIADALHDISDSVGFDPRYLCEAFNTAIGYSIDELDVTLIKEMLELARTPEGRKARCNVCTKDTANVIKRWMEIFAILAEHNGVDSETVKEQKVKMHRRTDYIVLKVEVEKRCPQLVPYIYTEMFLPTDAFPDDEDNLTATDRILYMEYVINRNDLSVDQMCGLYWCFEATREGENRKEFIEGLHSMNSEDKHRMMEQVKKRIRHEQRLDNNPDYSNVLQELARIEGG